MPYQARGLDIPALPEGLVYRNLGIMEHHICDIIIQRMKHRKASWSIKGAENLGKLLATKASKQLYEVIKKFSKITQPEDKTNEIIQILSAAKTPRKDGKKMVKVKMRIYTKDKYPLPIALLQTVEKLYVACLI
jgi:hypothetical protein